MSTGQMKLAQAQADIQAAEVVIAQERKAKLETDLREALETVGRIKKLIKDKGEYLRPLGTEAGEVWSRREVVKAEIRALTAQEFFSSEEIAAAEARLEVLDEEDSKLTERITKLTYLRAPVEHEIQNLEFDQRRMEQAVRDLRLSLSGQLQGAFTNGGATRNSGM